MSSILALSVSDKIDQYGAYAGFASVIGLAILSLLYFAQAREVKRLREWAGRAPERAADLQDRAVAAAQQRVVAQPQRPQPGQPARPGVPGAVPAAATPAGQAAGAAVPAAAAATAAGAATATPPAPGQPTTVQPAANPAANGAAQTPPGARPGEPLRAPAGAGTPGGVPPGSSRTNYGPDDRDDEGRSRLAVGGAIAAVVVVLIVIVVLLTGVLGGRDDSGTQATATVGTTANSTGRTRTTPTRRASATPRPGSYEVAVLNGTTVAGLARGVATRLQSTRFKIGTVTNAATQDRSATLVEYTSGHRAEAVAVAKAIDVASDSIQPISPETRTIAGDAATVVVTVGSDQNQQPAAPTGTTTTG